MALCSITTEEPNVIDPLIQVAVMLHGMLLIQQNLELFNSFCSLTCTHSISLF